MVSISEAVFTFSLGVISPVGKPCVGVFTVETGGNECTPTLDVVTVEALETAITGEAEGTEVIEEATRVDVVDMGAADAVTIEDKEDTKDKVVDVEVAEDEADTKVETSEVDETDVVEMTGDEIESTGG